MADLSALLKPVSTATATPTVAAPAAAGAGLVERIDAALQGILTDPVRLEQTAALLSGSNRGGSARVGKAAGQLAQSIDRRTAFESDLTSAQTNRGVSVAQEERLADSAAITDAAGTFANENAEAREERDRQLAEADILYKKNLGEAALSNARANTNRAAATIPWKEKLATGFVNQLGLDIDTARQMATNFDRELSPSEMQADLIKAMTENNFINRFTDEEIQQKAHDTVMSIMSDKDRLKGFGGGQEQGLGGGQAFDQEFMDQLVAEPGALQAFQTLPSGSQATIYAQHVATRGATAAPAPTPAPAPQAPHANQAAIIADREREAVAKAALLRAQEQAASRLGR